MRAVWTAVEDSLGRLLWPPLGASVDLLDNEPNIAGASVDLAHLRWQGRLTRPFYVRQRNAQWILRVHRDGVVKDGVDVEVGADVALGGGEVIGVADVGVAVRFDFVDKEPLERLAFVDGLLLLDHAGHVSGGPGRWWGLQRLDSGLREVLVVVDAAGRRRVVPGFSRGVPLRELCARGAGVEPSVAIDVLQTLARRAQLDRSGLGSPDHAHVGWDGELRYLPPLVGEAASPYGALVELFSNLLPESSPWWSDDAPASRAARDLWTRMVGPYLGGLGDRAHQADDLSTVDRIAAACRAVVDAGVVRDVAATELRDVARGLFPDEWRREQRLAEELALIDERAYEALSARA